MPQKQESLRCAEPYRLSAAQSEGSTARKSRGVFVPKRQSICFCDALRTDSIVRASSRVLTRSRNKKSTNIAQASVREIYITGRNATWKFNDFKNKPSKKKQAGLNTDINFFHNSKKNKFNSTFRNSFSLHGCNHSKKQCEGIWNNVRAGCCDAVT
jgi:hypothetical protein